VRGLVTYLKEQLGDEFLGADTVDDGDYRLLMISIGDAAKVSVLLGEFTATQVEPPSGSMPLRSRSSPGRSRTSRTRG
jgi:hypothetical protein